MLGRVFLRQMSSVGVVKRPYGGAEVKRGNLNDFPVPQGSWQQAYNARQTKNNIMLLFGVGCLVGTGLYIWQKDPFHWEYVRGPNKFMHNPPAFESPILETNILSQYENSRNQNVEKVTVATQKK